MSVNDASRIIIDNSRMVFQIVASLTDNSRGIIYNCNMLIDGNISPRYLLQICSEKITKFPITQLLNPEKKDLEPLD
jgi:hypothetical protein